MVHSTNFKGKKMKNKWIFTFGLVFFSQYLFAGSLMDAPQLQAMKEAMKSQTSASIEKTIGEQCLKAWKNQSNMPIFKQNNSLVSMMIPLKSTVERNVNFACQCIQGKPTLQGTLYGAIYINAHSGDEKAAKKFLSNNLRNTIRSCFWHRERNESGKYVSAADINLKVMLKKCKKNYTQILIKKKYPNSQPSIDEVLSVASTAEDSCSCMVNRSMVSRVTSLTVDLLNYELTGQNRASSMNWRMSSIEKALDKAAEKCGLK